MAHVYDWRFPLPRTHTGVLLGNGTLGAMVWGGGPVLRITLGRSDFWDHRGGMAWPEERTYARVRALLAAKDEAGLRRLFYQDPASAKQPARPSVLPLGRFDVSFDAGAVLEAARLDTDHGELTVSLHLNGKWYELVLLLDPAGPLLRVGLPDDLPSPRVVCVPAWDCAGRALAARGIGAPTRFEREGIEGWVQPRPADPPLCAAYLPTPPAIALTAVYGADENDAVGRATQELRAAEHEGAEPLRRRNRAWWAAYWDRTPAIDLPDERLAFHHRYGMYKFAGLARPGAPAATLQGPWIEEYQLPPWCSDYHFNINVQMCYWPAYPGNHLDHLDPLFDMLEAWGPILRENARRWAGIDDGLLLPHANDDCGTNMGGFWTGAVDHGSTAWMAQLLFQRYRYSLDEAFLRDRAFPFMRGAMRVYEAMLERDGERLVLPLGVSAEYGADGFSAWGRNASFQLSCIHRLCEDLLEACRVLGLAPDRAWEEIRARLPQAALVGEPGRERIALWEGQSLAESHRHHSHLAGLHPFDTIDWSEPTQRGIVDRSIAEWVSRGMGEWGGWSFPWAAMIHARLGNAEMAELLLHIWDRAFVNEGQGTLYYPRFPGLSRTGVSGLTVRPPEAEVMQMDAGMGAAAAVLELLLHSRRGVHHLFAGAPERWAHVAFDGIRTEAAFLVGATREDGRVREVRVTAPAGGTFRLANPWGSRDAEVVGDGRSERITGNILALSLAKDQVVAIRPG